MAMDVTSPSLFRGHCFRCGQRWILGRIDPDAGEYGRFFCAGCRDRFFVEEISPILAAPRKRLKKKAPADDMEVLQLRVGLEFRRRFVCILREPTNFRSCGATVWLSAFVLVNYMERELFRDPEGLQGLRIAELGAGCGVPGMALAQLGAEVLLTDVAGLCPLLERHIALNFLRSPVQEHGEHVCPRVAQLCWGNSEDLQSLIASERQNRRFDFLIGSDICYDRDAHVALLRTLLAMTVVGREATLSPLEPTLSELSGSMHGLAPRPGPRVILALPRRIDEFEAFHGVVVREGWSLHVLTEVDLEAECGDPSCNKVAVVELKRTQLPG